MNIRQQYREDAVRGASPVQLVVRLYEQLIEDLRQVATAIERNDIPQRTSRIQHAILVVGHLQSPLDFENGGKVAKDLDHFYNVVRQNLLQVQFFPARPPVTQLITDLLAVRQAWIEVERAENPSALTKTVTMTGTPGPGMVPAYAVDRDAEPTHVEWKG